MPECGRCGFAYAAQEQTAQFAPVVRAREIPPHVRPGRRRSATALLVALGVLLVLALGFALSANRRGRARGGGAGLVFVPPAGRSHDFTSTAVDARQIDSRLASSHATTGGDLEVSLAWNSLTDLDLQVQAPSGEFVYAFNWRAACGGVQDVDANPTLLTPEGEARYQSGQVPGAENVMQLAEHLADAEDTLRGMSAMEQAMGDGSRPPSHFTRKPVEHIYFAQAPRGKYRVLASCFSWREPNQNPLPFTVLVRSRGQEALNISGTIGPSSYCADGAQAMQVCSFAVR